MKSKKIDLIEFSRKGGNATKNRYGSEHYKEIQKIGNKVVTSKYGKEHFRKMGKISAMKRKKAQEEMNKPLIDKFAEALTGN